MKKLVLTSAIAGVLAMGSAHAVPTSINLDGGKPLPVAADTYTLFWSGASATNALVEKLFGLTSLPNAEKVCKTGVDADGDEHKVYKLLDAATSGKENFAFYCDLNTANPALSTLTAGKKTLLVYKRDLGGSAVGVLPLVTEGKTFVNNPAAQVNFLKLDDVALHTTSPTLSATTGLWESKVTWIEGDLTKSQNHVPDFGVSDVDPDQFKGLNGTVQPGDTAVLNIDSVGSQVFGITATLKLRNALQKAQGLTVGSDAIADVPSLTRDQVTSLFTGKMNSWKDFKVTVAGVDTNLLDNANAVDKPTGTNAAAFSFATDTVHICSRTDGSGTKAVLGVNFLNYPCAGTTVATPWQAGVPASADPVTVAAARETNGTALTHNNGSSGDLEECLRELDAGSDAIGTKFTNKYATRWAVGIQGLEKNASNGAAYRFVKIDGVLPTLENVSKGLYHDWAELTIQTAKNHFLALPADEKAIITELTKAAGNPTVLGAIDAATANQVSIGLSGYLASPKLYTADANGKLVTTAPINPYTHATGSAAVNNCRFPASFTGNVQVK